jgi:hypothetical protein
VNLAEFPTDLTLVKSRKEAETAAINLPEKKAGLDKKEN